MLITTIILIIITITGPVGKLLSLILIKVPSRPDIQPKKAAKITIIESLSVHCRAATAGEISIALINITPAA